MNGEWSPVHAGETAPVPAGVPHSVPNASDEPARIVNIHKPAQRFESFFRDMHRLIHEGKIKRLPPKDPRSAIYAAMLFASTRTRSERPNHRIGYSRRWPSSGGRSVSRFRGDAARCSCGLRALRRRASSNSENPQRGGEPPGNSVAVLPL